MRAFLRPDLTKKARAISCSAPPPLGRLHARSFARPSAAPVWSPGPLPLLIPIGLTTTAAQKSIQLPVSSRNVNSATNTFVFFCLLTMSALIAPVDIAFARALPKIEVLLPAS